MKLKKRRFLEVPSKIKSFINIVTATPLDNIAEPLRSFVWEFDKGDFHHWIDLFNHFDSFFEKYIKPRKDLQFEEILESDIPFPKDAVIQVLRVIRIVLENCTNKHLYSSYEQHLSFLLASTDADVIEACLQTFSAFFKKTIGKASIQDRSLNSKLFSLAQGWGGKEAGLGLVECAVRDVCDSIAHELGCTLQFEFYASDDLHDVHAAGKPKPMQGLRVIHLPDVNSRPESDLELLHKLVAEYEVPLSLRFSVFTRLRFARAFGSPSSRRQYTCIRLYAFIILVQTGNDSDLSSFFASEPEFVSELVSLLSYEDAAPEKIRILCLLSLVALSQDRSHQPTVLAAVTSVGYRGILSSLMQKSIDSVVHDASRWSVVFAEALLSLITVLATSSSSCSAMREAGFVPILLPLLKDMNPQHVHLVSASVHILETFMDYSNPAVALFRELGGLDDAISRLRIEASYVENGLLPQGDDSNQSGSWQAFSGTSSEPDSLQPLYSDALISYHRRLLLKALLRAISLGTYPPGNTSHLYGSEESLLPQCLCVIFRRAKNFGGGIFSLAATVMSDLIQKDPTCFPVLDAAGLPSAFLDAIADGVLCSSEAILCIPQCLDALCLNNNGRQTVKDRNALRCFVKIFTSALYLRALTGETPGSLSSGLDELMRHASSLRGPGVDMLVEILNAILRIGSGAVDASSSQADPKLCPGPVPMATIDEGGSPYDPGEGQNPAVGFAESAGCSSSDSVTVRMESFLPDFVSNAAHLLETILQNADVCRIFIEKKGIDSVLQLLAMPLLPLTASVGQSIFIAFKNFSPQHYASLARALCSFLKEHLRSTNELLLSISGTQLTLIELERQTKLLRYFSSLDGLLTVCNFLLKGTSSVVSELGTSDADVLMDVGVTYREVVWQVSLCDDCKIDSVRPVGQEAEASESSPPTSTADVEASEGSSMAAAAGQVNSVSIRSGSQSLWRDRDFVSFLRSGDNMLRRSRHGLARIRSGRTSRHMDSLTVIDSDALPNPASVSSRDVKKKNPDVLVPELLTKLAATLRAFFVAIVKAFTSPNRRRGDAGSLSPASRTLGSGIAKVFVEALSFSGHSATIDGLSESPPSVKCRYLGKVVDDIGTLVFDGRRHTCHTIIVNNFYVHGALKELLTTFEATSQLLWSPPCPPLPASNAGGEKADEKGNKLAHVPWLLATLQSYCNVLKYFVNSQFLLSSSSSSHAQLLVQPVVGLSIGLFPVPKDPEVLVQMLQSQVMDAILPVWNHPMFPDCSPAFVTSIVSLVTHIYSDAVDMKKSSSGVGRGAGQRMIPPPDEAAIATIVEMGFTRGRAEEALRRVETNSVEMAMEWLFAHPEDTLQEDDELARALALSLGSSSDGSKANNDSDKSGVVVAEGKLLVPPIDDVLSAVAKLFHRCGEVAFVLSDLLVTLSHRSKGQARPIVVASLVQQLKLCPLDFSGDCSGLPVVSHVLAVLLFEDVDAREIAVQNGIVPAALDILMNFKAVYPSGSGLLVPNSISAILLVLGSLLQYKPRAVREISEAACTELQHDLLDFLGEEDSFLKFEKILGKSTGYLTVEDCSKALLVACDLIKWHVPALVMQAALQLSARLTKTHCLALQFLEHGGLAALLDLPTSCFFAGFDAVASAVVRHLLEDPLTLQAAMESEIRLHMSGKRHDERVLPRAFLTAMAPIISRDPVVFLRAFASVCRLETSAGINYVVLLNPKEKEKEKEREKEKEKSKSLNAEELVQMSESKMQDDSAKYHGKAHKRVPVVLSQVVEQLVDVVMRFHPSANDLGDSQNDVSMVDADLSASNSRLKGKSKLNEVREVDAEVERSAGLAKVTFVLKLLIDIVLMYGHAAGIILKRDLELCQLHGPNPPDRHGEGGMICHILHRLLPVSADKSAGLDDWRAKLSGKVQWFLVVLCNRSGEGRRRVVNELVKEMASFPNLRSGVDSEMLLPDERVLAYADLVYSILSKNTSSSLASPGCVTDIARCMINGGVIRCVTDILRAIDLDHPDAPKVINLLLKALECLTRAANANEHAGRPKKKPTEAFGSHDDQTTVSAAEAAGGNQNVGAAREAPFLDEVEEGQYQHEVEGQIEPSIREAEEMMSTNLSVEVGMDFVTDEMEGRAGDQIELTFRFENREDDMGDEDDDVGEEGEEEEEEEEEEDVDDGEDEEDGTAEDAAGMMSLADTDVEDQDVADDFNEDMMDEEEDDEDFHENPVIEVRWREAFDGLDNMQLLGQTEHGSHLLDISAEPFEGVNVDDLFGPRRPFRLEHHRQSGRPSFSHPLSDVSRFQHPLLSRPSQAGDVPSSLWPSRGAPPRDSDAPSDGIIDIAHFYMLLAPVLPNDRSQNSHLGSSLHRDAAAPLSDSSAGESFQRLGDRLPSDGRWADDGLPQPDAQASIVAQAIEAPFLNLFLVATSSSNAPELKPLNSPNEAAVSEVHATPTLPAEVPQQPNGSESGCEHDMETEHADCVPRISTTGSPAAERQASYNLLVNSGLLSNPDRGIVDVDMDASDGEGVHPDAVAAAAVAASGGEFEPSAAGCGLGAALDGGDSVAPATDAIDPTFLEALPEDLRAEVLATQHAQSVPPSTFVPPSVDDIDPEFLAALPPDIQTEVLAQQRAQRIAQQTGQPVDMDNASIIATFPADLREEVLLTSSEAVLSALPSSLLAEAQMLRDRAMSHFHAHSSIFGNSSRLTGRRNGIAFDRSTMDRDVGHAIGRMTSSALAMAMKVKEVDGEPLLDADALRAIVRLLQLAQPLGKGLLQRVLLNLCANAVIRATLICIFIDILRPEAEGSSNTKNCLRLYGCQSDVVYGRSPSLCSIPPLLMRRILEMLTYLATNHSSIANLFFFLDPSVIPECFRSKSMEFTMDIDKNTIGDASTSSKPMDDSCIPVVVFLKLLKQPLFLRSSAHLEQLLELTQVVLVTAISQLECQDRSVEPMPSSPRQTHSDESGGLERGPHPPMAPSSNELEKHPAVEPSDEKKRVDMHAILLRLPQSDLHNLCHLLGFQGLSDKGCLLTGEVIKKLASVALPHRKFFVSELAELARNLCGSAMNELVILKNTRMLGLSASSMAGPTVLRVIQVLSKLMSAMDDANHGSHDGAHKEHEEHAMILNLTITLEPLWRELSACISATEAQLGQGSHGSAMLNLNVVENVHPAASSSSSSSSPLPSGAQRLLPFVEAFFVLCEMLQDHAHVIPNEVKESAGCSDLLIVLSCGDSQRKLDCPPVMFSRFAEKHRRLLNAFIKQNPVLLEKSLSMLLKAPRLIDFDNKRAYFRSRIRQTNEQHLSGPLRISVRRAYVLEDSYNQLRMRSSQDLKGRLNVQFQGEEGIDAGGLTREWYQLLSRVIFDKGALLFTTVANNTTFQPNPNSVYQTEHLSYFKFVGRLVAKALFDGQLLDVHFTRSFYKHILGIKVTYHDIEAVDPDYYKNLKWMLENDVSDVPDLTFSIDADEEKHILYEKTEVMDYELKPGGRNTRVTEETKQEYIDLVADHILTNAIRPQINVFLEGFNELIPRELISIFNDKELELLISGLPEIDLEDLRANTDYIGYTIGSNIVQWFWEAVSDFNKEDMARLLQFVTGTSKVPLDGFKALQGISGPQKFQIHKAYGAPQRLPSAHTCFNQLDLPEYTSKEQLEERLLLAIHEASEGFGFD